jgi:hypothetical protein
MRKKINPYLSLCMMLSAFITTAITISCKEKEESINITEIILDRENLTLSKGNETALSVKLYPYNAQESDISWTSSNTDVATVKNGKVKGVRPGTATVTAQAGNITASCAVTVKVALVGAVYFDGWPQQASTKLTTQYSLRQPVWGWSNDSQGIVEQEIDLAADNGIDFFAYCWYWHTNEKSISSTEIKSDPKHLSLQYLQQAKNKKRIRFTLIVCNHAGFRITGADNWAAAVTFWAENYFTDPQYMTVDGKPFVIIYDTEETQLTEAQLERMQEAAREAGFKNGINIAGCKASQRVNVHGYIYDTFYNSGFIYAGTLEALPYTQLIATAQSKWQGSEQLPFIPNITCGWDSRPWQGDGGGAPDGPWYVDDTPDLFKGFLRDAFSWMDNHPLQTARERIVCIYAWNELGEGGWLVPTVGDPNASKLKKIKELLDEYNK